MSIVETATQCGFACKGIKEGLFVNKKDDLSQLRDDEVVVAPRITGMCGSDAHLWGHGRIGKVHVDSQDAIVMGHESSGVIVKVGKSVKALKAGDKVALEPGASCGTCNLCQDGKYQMCSTQIFSGSPAHDGVRKVDGSLQTFYKTPAHYAHKLPDSMSLEEGAMIEPLAVAMHAVHRIGQIKGNANVIVFGAGPVGLLSAASARALGARRVIVVEVVEARLEFARKFAATDVFLPPKRNTNEDGLDYAERAVKEMKSTLNFSDQGTEGIDLIIECSGAEPCIQMAFHAVRIGGTIVQVGLGRDSFTIPVIQQVFKEINYKGSVKYGAGIYSLCIDLVAQKKISLLPMVTHRYKFEDSESAFNALLSGKGYDGKVPIKILVEGPPLDLKSLQ